MYITWQQDQSFENRDKHLLCLALEDGRLEKIKIIKKFLKLVILTDGLIFSFL